jgi:protein-disulfide isomerase
MSKLHHYYTKLKSSISFTTPVAIIIGSLIIALSILAHGYITRGEAGGDPANQISMFLGRPPDATDHIEGNLASTVTVIEYSDPECPFCISLHPSMKKLRLEYGDKISFIYRTFPLTQIHPHALDESRAITCAGIVAGTKGYYSYIDALFGYKSSHKTTQLPATGKEDIAKSVGLDAQSFSTCMASNEPGQIVEASTNDGTVAGVTGTPSTFILARTNKGYEVVSNISGAQSYSYFKAGIDEALSK